MSDFAFATLLRQDPAAALATLKEMIDPPSITSRFRANVGVLIGLYVVVFILFTMDVFLRLRDKKMWIFRKDESGHLRMNLFLAFHVLLGAYSIGWIAALAMYLSPAVPRSTVIVFQLFNYLLLTVTGYAEIFALATQLPRTQSVVTFHTPARLNPVQRLFSSTLRIRLSLIILFTLLLCGTTILAVFAGLGMRREENLWKMIEGRILAASHIGWAELAYLETLKELVILKDGKGVIYWSRYLGVFYLTVTSLQQVLYIPSTLGVFRLLNRQSQHLQRSLTNLSVLRALSPNPANSSPPSTSSHSPLSPVPLPASPRNSVHSSEDTINIDKMEIDLGAKLESVRNQRSMVILQAIVTEVIAVAFFVYSVFSVANGFSKVTPATGRAISIFLPSYSFLAPTLIAAIFFGHLARGAAIPKAFEPPTIECQEWVPYSTISRSSSKFAEINQVEAGSKVAQSASFSGSRC